MPTSHNQLSDSVFEQQFADCSLPPSLFSHEAHLRLAWIHIRTYGVEQAVANLREQIKRYASSLGVQRKYNETVTVASVKVMHHFMQRSSAEHFKELINVFPSLKQDFKKLLGEHYSKDIFRSESARKEYLEPDLLPFDPVTFPSSGSAHRGSFA